MLGTPTRDALPPLSGLSRARIDHALSDAPAAWFVPPDERSGC